MSTNTSQENDARDDMVHDDADMSDGSDVDDDSSDSSEADEASDEVLQLQQQVGFNPSYENYEKYIAALRSALSIDELRQAREDMASRYPLDKAMWIQWIDDEVRIGTKPDRIMKLFERSVQDFLSVDLWLRYVEYACGEAEDSQSVVSVLERAIDACGSHFTEGHALWEAYRHYEKDPERQKKLFIRQLGIPSLQMEDIMSQYSSWHQSAFNCPAPEVPSFSKAHAAYHRLLPFEGDLLTADQSNLQRSWTVYINSELSENHVHVHRVVTLFERALAVLFSFEFFWQKYIRFLRMNRSRNDYKTSLLATCRRAVRNCPWSVSLWCEFIISASVDEPTLGSARAVFEEAMNQSFQTSDSYVQLVLEICYAEACRFQSESDPEPFRALFKRASAYDQYSDSTQPFTDAMFNLYRYWADIELHLFNSTEKARDCWSVILKRAAKQPQFWIQYFQFEQGVGDLDKCRSAFRRGVHMFQHDDGLQTISSAWVKFETEHGSIESRDEAVNKTSLLLEKRYLKQLSEVSNGSQAATTKRKMDSSEKAENNSRKRIRSEPKDVPQTTASASSNPATIFTAFALNVDHKVSEKELEQLFSPFGEVIQIRIPRDFRGRKRGFAYIDFSQRESVEAAIKALDRTELHGRFLKIEEFKGDATRVARKTIRSQDDLESLVESNIVFLKGINKDLSQANAESALLERFGKYGNICQVRIPPAGRSSRLKGIAYIEFESESQAGAALAEDGFQLNGCTVSVAISNPPGKQKQENPNEPAAPKSQSARRVQFQPRGFAVPQIPVNRHRKPVLDMNLSESERHPQNESIGKSNADFRNMLLNKQK